MDVLNVICQDQLNRQPNGQVTVTWPAGSDTVLSVQPNGMLDTRPAGTAEAYELATVLDNGNLLYRPAGTQGFVILGASLK